LVSLFINVQCYSVSDLFGLFQQRHGNLFMAERYYISREYWASILNVWLEKFFIIAPRREEGGLYFHEVDNSSINSIIVDEVRTVQPLKNYLLPPVENIIKKNNNKNKPWLFLGVKACDLAALPILDQAFGGDFADPLYQSRREESIIVSADCNKPLSTCFCSMVGGDPFPTRGFDLNISKVWEGYVVEIGSLRGKELLEGFDKALKEVVKEENEAVEKMRKQTRVKVLKNNRDFDFNGSYTDIVSKSWESEVYKKHVETCVECGACNNVCPTCHCYMLEDASRKEFVKLRGWDSCQYTGYAVTAGGGTPRPRLFERFRNRYFCKFKYLEENYGQLGCTGCGRCIEACQGKIDMRVVLKDLAAR